MNRLHVTVMLFTWYQTIQLVVVLATFFIFLAITKADNRSAMRAILSTFRFLGRQGLPLHGTLCNDDVEGGSESNSNLLQLLHLRANDIPQLKEWLKKALDKFRSPSIQTSC